MTNAKNMTAEIKINTEAGMTRPLTGQIKLVLPDK